MAKKPPKPPKPTDAEETAETTAAEEEATVQPRPRIIKPKDDPRHCPACAEFAAENRLTDKLERVEDETGTYHCLRCKSKRLVPRRLGKK